MRLLLVLFIAAVVSADPICLLQWTSRVNPATGEVYGWVAYNPEKPAYIYVLNMPDVKWDRMARVTVSDTPESLSRAKTGTTLDDVISQHTATSAPYWSAKARLCTKARAHLLLIRGVADKLPWPPYDPDVGEIK